MKSIKISNDLYKMIARAAETKESSVEDHLDYWLRLGQKA